MSTRHDGTWAIATLDEGIVQSGFARKRDAVPTVVAATGARGVRLRSGLYRYQSELSPITYYLGTMYALKIEGWL